MQQTPKPEGVRSGYVTTRMVALLVVTAVLALLAAACSSVDPVPAGVDAVPLDNAVEAGADEATADADGPLTVDTGDGDQAAAETDSPVGGADSQPAPTIEAGKLAEEVGPILGETGDGLADDDLEVFLARRYEAFWQAVDLARQAPTQTPSIDYPELAQLADGQQLEAIYQDVESLFTSGHAIRDPENPAVPGLDANSAHRVRVELEGDAVAHLYSCLVNDQVRYEVPTGSVLYEAVMSVAARSTMARSEGTWKIIRSEATALEPGVGGCWLEPEENFPL